MYVIKVYFLARVIIFCLIEEATLCTPLTRAQDARYYGRL